jgi:hypothetical protein
VLSVSYHQAGVERKMKLQDFLGKDIKWSTEAIAADSELPKQIQIRLVALELLGPPADGKFGPISTAALKQFQDLTKCDEPNFLGQVTAKKLIETKTQELPVPQLDLGDDLASCVAKYMQQKKYHVATGAKELNIVYIEGLNPDGTLNDDKPNEFNDVRMVIEFVNGKPKIAGIWEGTTEPGWHYTVEAPMNEKGAARIQFGQYKAWRMGMHGTSHPHRALVQVAPVSVHRDFDQNFKRIGDFVDTGIFAINQHWGYDYSRNDVKNAGAGCLVGRSTTGHEDFLRIIEQDSRYLATPFGLPIFPGDPSERTYVFISTIIPGDELVKLFPKDKS